MMAVVALVIFGLAVVATTLWIARRDVLVAGFFMFFFVYTIFAMVGYRFFPVVSWALGFYFGPDVYDAYFRFVALSFAAFAAAFALLRPLLIREGRYAVEYAPRIGPKLAYYAATALFVVAMAGVFALDRDRIDYASDPAIPRLWFAIAFKEMAMLSVVLYAVARRHAAGAFERLVAWSLFAAQIVVFLLVAGKSGSRSDVMEFMLGVATYELYPAFVVRGGGIRLRPTARRARVLVATVLVAACGLALMLRIQLTREGEATPLPRFAQLLYNDYYAPAHLLFGAIAVDYVRPADLVKSHAANAVFLGRVLNVPYPQTDLANIAVPGSSSRVASPGFYIFAEGYVAMGRWGFLYNGVIPLLGIAAWRLLSSSQDRRFNAFGTALCAMFFAAITRSGNLLLFRHAYFMLLPGVVLFSVATGARLRATTAPRHRADAIPATS